MGAPTTDRVLWRGTTMAHGIEGACEAAVAGGFTAISVFPHDCDFSPAGAKSVRALADRFGLRVAVLDTYARWVPCWAPPVDRDADLVAALSMSEDQAFELAAILGAETINVFEAFGVAQPFDALVERFAALCDRAHGYGRRINLEFTPLGTIPDLSTGWAIVTAADRRNGGLLLDTWHYFRGGPDADLLAQIPGDRIFHVQVSGGWAKPRAATMMEDTIHNRCLPDEGDWDIADVVHKLRSKPGIGQFGIEAFCDEIAALPPAEIGRRSSEALGRVLDRR
jgi:sugar phosphate isomerase/epimerase